MTENSTEDPPPRSKAATDGNSQTDGQTPAAERKRNTAARVVRPQAKTARKDKTTDGGKLKIGDDWNAIRIIALSQSNPLKAIAEFVENSIDAHAKTITITRGREHGAH